MLCATMSCNQNCDDEFVEVAPTCFGIRTIVGPFIDEPIVAGLDRCFKFLGIKICKPVDCCDECILTVGSCQATSTSNLCCERKISLKKCCNTKECICKKCCQSSNKNIYANVTIEDDPDPPKCTNYENQCENKVICVKSRKCCCQNIPVSAEVFIQDSVPYLPSCRSQASSIPGNKSKPVLQMEDDSNLPMIPIQDSSIESCQLSMQQIIPERLNKIKSSHSKRKQTLSPVMSCCDVNIPERETCIQKVLSPEDSFQQTCPFLNIESDSKYTGATISICESDKSSRSLKNRCNSTHLSETKIDQNDNCPLSELISKNNIESVQNCDTKILYTVECSEAPKTFTYSTEASVTPPESFTAPENRRHTSQSLVSKDSLTKCVKFSDQNVELHRELSNMSLKSLSNRKITLPFKLAPNQKFRNMDTATETDITTSPTRKKLRDKKKVVRNINLPVQIGGIAHPSAAQIISTQWAICRINMFSDHSRLFQIMETKIKIPNFDESKTIMFFAVLTDGSTVSFKPDDIIHN